MSSYRVCASRAFVDANASLSLSLSQRASSSYRYGTPFVAAATTYWYESSLRSPSEPAFRQSFVSRLLSLFRPVSAQRGVVMNCVGSMVTSFPCGVCAGDLGVAAAHFSTASFRSVIPLAPLADRNPGTSPNARPLPSPPMANSGVPASSSGAALSDTNNSLGGRRFFTGVVRVPTADARSVASPRLPVRASLDLGLVAVAVAVATVGAPRDCRAEGNPESPPLVSVGDGTSICVRPEMADTPDTPDTPAPRRSGTVTASLDAPRRSRSRDLRLAGESEPSVSIARVSAFSQNRGVRTEEEGWRLTAAGWISRGSLARLRLRDASETSPAPTLGTD